MIVEDLNKHTERARSGARLMAALTGVMTADFTGFIQEVDKSVVKLKQLESASDHTSEGMQEFSDGINQVDQSLNAVGINIGKPVKALQELSALAGKNVGDMGLPALAGSMATAGVAGYELGQVDHQSLRVFWRGSGEIARRFDGRVARLGRSRRRDGGGEADEPQPRVRHCRAVDHEYR